MDNKFEFKYSALTESERREVEFIQSQYTKKQHALSKIDQLRKLDNKVKNIPTTLALICGISGTLIFGLGLALILEWNKIIFGVILGILGFGVICMAYFVYKKIHKILKNKYASDIINLSEELLYENARKEL